MAYGIAYPSYMGVACVIPSPQSRTVPVVRPVANNDKTDWFPKYNFWTSKV